MKPHKKILSYRLKHKEWWIEATASLFGTIVGIILTIGTTYWQQEIDNANMAKKITKITLHNIDVRMEHINSAVNELAAKDSIFQSLQAALPNQLMSYPADSLQQTLNRLVSQTSMLTDTKSETIFSHSFEVWQYLDDEKIIGRISNCYSVIDFGEGLLREWNQQLDAIVHRCRVDNVQQGVQADPHTIALHFLQDPETIILFDNIQGIISPLRQLIPVTQMLNDRNKQILRLSNEELEEVGNLLDTNSYSFQP